jgi:hypothetical protein
MIPEAQRQTELSLRPSGRCGRHGAASPGTFRNCVLRFSKAGSAESRNSSAI